MIRVPWYSISKQFLQTVIKSQLKQRSERELQRQNSGRLNAYEQYLTVINFWSASSVDYSAVSIGTKRS